MLFINNCDMIWLFIILKYVYMYEWINWMNEWIFHVTDKSYQYFNTNNETKAKKKNTYCVNIIIINENIINGNIINRIIINTINLLLIYYY